MVMVQSAEAGAPACKRMKKSEQNKKHQRCRQPRPQIENTNKKRNDSYLHAAVAVLKINSPRVHSLVSASDLKVIDTIDLRARAEMSTYTRIIKEEITFLTTLGSAAMRLPSSSKIACDLMA